MNNKCTCITGLIISLQISSFNVQIHLKLHIWWTEHRNKYLLGVMVSNNEIKQHQTRTLVSHLSLVETIISKQDWDIFPNEVSRQVHIMASYCCRKQANQQKVRGGNGGRKGYSNQGVSIYIKDKESVDVLWNGAEHLHWVRFLWMSLDLYSASGGVGFWFWHYLKSTKANDF